jgi:hypothetical protein
MNADLFNEDLLITNGKIPIVKEVVPELMIYQHYAPDLHLGTQVSPFRLEKNSPSFGLYEANGKISFKDHGHGAQGDIYDFVRQWYKQFKDRDITQQEINAVIYYDMKLSENSTVDYSMFFTNEAGPHQFKNERKGKFKLQVNDIGWTDWALEYWIERYNIAPSILNRYYCGHAKEVWATPPGKKTYLWGVSTPQSPIFYFYFPLTGNMKCYAPMEKKKNRKWIMNCDNATDIQGYHQIQIKKTRPKLVIFTKAMKEIMFYRSFHLDGLAIHGESHYYSDDFIRHIKKYSDHQLGVLDNDRAGQHASWMLRKKNKIVVSFIEQAKNITDLWEKEPHAVEDYMLFIKDYYKL